jgi:AraC family transcriptional regulator
VQALTIAPVITPEPVIVDVAPLHVAGLRYVGANTNGELAVLWETFLSRRAELVTSSDGNATYGVARGCAGCRNDEFEYLAGVEVKAISLLPKEMVRWRIPAQTYAVVFAASADEIGPVIDQFYRSWLPRQLEYAPVDGPSFEYYPAEYPENPAVYMYFPISRA